MNVLHVVNSLEVGGLEKFVLSLSNNYIKFVNCYFVCLSNEGELYSKSQNNMFFINKNDGLSLKPIIEIIKLVKKYKIDLIHTHNQAPQLYGALAGFFSNVKVVHTKHGRNEPHLPRRVKLDKFSSFLTRAIVPVSADAADVCIKVIGINPKKIHLILNGIDTVNFMPGPTGVLRSMVHCKADYALIGIVARLSPEKDHVTLIEACSILRSKGLLFRLAIIGDGPRKTELVALVKQLDLLEEIHFLGTRHDVASLMADLDLFVLSSTTEGVSLTLLEAMSCGIPIVATNVGGTPEVVVDGTTGYLVPSKNPEALAERMSDILLDSNLGKRMGRAGRERVVDKFSIKETAGSYLKLYHSILRQ